MAGGKIQAIDLTSRWDGSINGVHETRAARCDLCKSLKDPEVCFAIEGCLPTSEGKKNDVAQIRAQQSCKQDLP